jgi:hypothetical protein
VKVLVQVRQVFLDEGATMSGLADQLNDILGKPDGEALSTLDLMSLPSPVRRVINLMLRKVKITYPELCKTIADLPEEKRLSQAELDEILGALCQVGWLDQEQSDGVATYKVSLNPKPGSVSANSPLDVIEKENAPAAPMPQIAVRNTDSNPPQPSGGFLNWIKEAFGSTKAPK